MTAVALMLLFSADLALREPPHDAAAPGLRMRSAQAGVAGRVRARATATAPATAQTDSRAGPVVRYRLNVGYGLDNARATGGPAPTGFRGNPRQTLLRSFLLGDAVVGGDLSALLPVQAYFAATYYYDFLGAARDTPFATVFEERRGRALVIRSAYAELDPATQGQAPVWLRGGRQFRFGAGAAHFDGASGGYDDGRIELSGFAGRRVPLWANERVGIVAGGALRARLAHIAAALDVLTFEGDVHTDVTVQASRGGARAILVSRLFGDELSSVELRTRLPLGRRFLLLVDGEQKIGAAPVYDYVSGRETGGLRFFTLPEALAYSRIRAGSQIEVASELELLPYATLRIVEGERTPGAGPARTGYDAHQLELGTLGDWRPGGGLSLVAGYRARLFARPDPATQPRLDNPRSAGEVTYHELLADGRYTLGARQMTVTAGGFLRFYEIATPFARWGRDVRAGLHFDIESWVAARVRFKASYELADPSPTLAPDIDTMQSMRVIAEAVF